MNGRNPLLPPQFPIPDGEAHVMPDGRVYLYGSMDQHSDSFCSQEYVVASSENLRDWTVSSGLHEITLRLVRSKPIEITDLRLIP